MIIELLIIAVVLVLAVVILRALLGFAIKFVWYTLIVFAILFLIGLFL